jgi:hypothetical protein
MAFPNVLTPISHLFLNESDRQQISFESDYLEARERTSHLRLANTTHYHIDFDINIGLTEDQLDFLRKEVRDRESIETLTFQASRDCEKVALVDYAYVPKSRILSIEEQVDNAKRTKKQIEDIVGTNRIIGFENNNFYATGAYSKCTSLEFLTRVIEDAKYDWLFDIAHAIVTCTNQKISFDEYSTTLLKTNKCIQLHICEPDIVYSEEVGAIDAHNLPSLTLTQYALDCCEQYDIKNITVEYYKDAKILYRYLNAIKKFK